MHDIERYLTIRSAYGASLSPSGRLAFLLTTTGTAQIWTLDGPEGWPDQRTFYDETVGFCTFSPTREELVFGMDEGGNERTQLYRLDLDPDSDTEGEVTPLTDHPEKKHLWGAWDADGDRVSFSSNRRDEAVFDVYVQGRTDDEAELVYESDGWFSAGAFSPDGDRLIVTEARGLLEQDIHVLDLGSGALTCLTDGDEPARFTSASWGPDGEYVYCTTDRGADTKYLARLSLAGDLEPVVEGGEWNVGGFALDQDSGRIVYGRNVDGYTELTAGDLDGTTVRGERVLDLPKGVAGGLSFDEGAHAASLTVTTSTRNTNVHVADLAAGELTRWTRAATAGIPPETFVEPELVRFESFDGREIPAFFSLPRETPVEGVPVIVDIHGGPESQRRPSFNPVKQYFLAHGYAVLEPNVRGSTGYGKAYSHLDDVRRRMDSVKDIAAAVEWLTDQPAVDPDRLVAYGGSYGGFMVLASMTEYPDLWAAGVDSVGIANFVTFLENTGDWRRKLRETEYGSLDEDREFLESISPINNVERIRAPLMVLHGANDPRVPLGEAEQIAERAAEHVPVETVIFEDEGHGFSKLENRKEAYSRIVAFLDEHV